MKERIKCQQKRKKLNIYFQQDKLLFALFVREDNEENESFFYEQENVQNKINNLIKTKSEENDGRYNEPR